MLKSKTQTHKNSFPEKGDHKKKTQNHQPKLNKKRFRTHL